MDRLLTFVSIVAVVLVLAVLALVRRSHIRVEYSVSWLAAGLAVLVLAQWRALLDAIASVIGTENAATTLLILAGGVFLLVLFRISLIVSTLKEANVALAQKVAILEFRLESLDEKAKAPAAN